MYHEHLNQNYCISYQITVMTKKKVSNKDFYGKVQYLLTSKQRCKETLLPLWLCFCFIIVTWRRWTHMAVTMVSFFPKSLSFLHQFIFSLFHLLKLPLLHLNTFASSPFSLLPKFLLLLEGFLQQKFPTVRRSLGALILSAFLFQELGFIHRCLNFASFLPPSLQLKEIIAIWVRLFNWNLFLC